MPSIPAAQRRQLLLAIVDKLGLRPRLSPASLPQVESGVGGTNLGRYPGGLEETDGWCC
jgi:hypothetical protein